MPKRPDGRILALLALLFTFIGCSTPPSATPPIAPELVRAEALFQEGRVQEAIRECIELERKDPLMPGLAEMQARIVSRLAKDREDDIKRREEPAETRMMNDIEAQARVPDTYKLPRHIAGVRDEMHTPASPIQQILEREVSVHLADVTLNDFIAQVGASENINIVADGQLSGATMTIHADNTPLAEILDYVSRNLGVTFSVGRNIIWVTAGTAADSEIPLLTRIYHLRRGLSGDELLPGSDDAVYAVDAIKRFVPQAAGADILFNRKAHALLIKNSSEALALTEDIIAALDITPPQILIDARFISVQVADLRELGVDWILNSPWVMTTDSRMINGKPKNVATTVLGTGSSVTGSEFADSANQGLNLTYEGVLTDPMFTAVVHALETSGRTRTLSVPRVMTVNNRLATIRIGKDVYYFEEFELQDVRDGSDNNGNATYVSRLAPIGSPTKEEIGISLDVLPSVGADLSTITLNLIPEISELLEWEYLDTVVAANASTGNNNNNNSGGSTNVTGAQSGLVRLPVFQRTRIETEMQVQSGETVVLGGLIRSSREKRREGVPILQHIPLLGQLFRHDVWDEKRENVLIFVTATLVSETGEDLLPVLPAGSEPVAVGGNPTTPLAPPLSLLSPAPAAGILPPASFPERVATPAPLPDDAAVPVAPVRPAAPTIGPEIVPVRPAAPAFDNDPFAL